MAKILFTVGFTKKSARSFFSILNQNNVTQLIDVRLNNTSQLAGYTKKDDFEYFLEEICHCSYKHIPELAPTKDILDAYHKKEITWAEYETKYNLLLSQRLPHSSISPDRLDHSCLLCAEPTPEKCHRRLAAEYICKHFEDVIIKHL